MIKNRKSPHQTVSSLNSIQEKDLLYHEHPSMRSVWFQYRFIEDNPSEQKYAKREMCCASDKQRPWVLKVTFLVIVALALIVSAVRTIYSLYPTRKVILTGGDQMLFPTSTYINEKLLVTPLNTNDSKYIKLYLLKDKPEISNTTKISTFAGKFYQSSWTYQYWGLHLLKGSQVQISVCADLHLQFYILQGRKKFKKWTQETLYSKYDYHANVKPTQNCSKTGDFVSHVVTVAKSDIYYLFFVSSVGWRFLTEVTVSLKLNRTYYDLSNVKYSCFLSDKNCSGNLTYGSNDITLLHVGPTSNNSYPSPFHKVSLYYGPYPRFSFYLMFHGFIFISILVLTILYTIWRAVVNCINADDTEEKISLLGNEQIHGKSVSFGSSFYQKDEIESSCENDPQRIERQDSLLARSTSLDSTSRDLNHDFARNASLTNLSTASAESNFRRSRLDSEYRDQMDDMAQYMIEQQLLDSVMTSAGVSAI